MVQVSECWGVATIMLSTMVRLYLPASWAVFGFLRGFKIWHGQVACL